MVSFVKQSGGRAVAPRLIGAAPRNAAPGNQRLMKASRRRSLHPSGWCKCRAL